MQEWLQVVSVIASFSTLIAFVGIFIKMGREKGISEAVQNEMRKDTDKNANDINALGQKVNQMQIDSTKLITALTADLAWIKANLTDIKTEMSKKKEK